MTWKPYDLDHRAMSLVLSALRRDPKSLNQAYKMRTTCAFGLERFWGEHLRLLQSSNKDDKNKGMLVQDTWDEFRKLMTDITPSLAAALPTIIEVNIPGEAGEARSDRINHAVEESAQSLWSLKIDDQRNCLSVLTVLCDAVVWWTQRLKPNQTDAPVQE
jgi:hypothetical protein